jgi:hypothetical protein
MPESVLRQPDVYRPFNGPEVDRLNGFVIDARLLGNMQLFNETPTTASWGFSAEEGESSSIDEPADESVRAAITVLRQLYNHKEPHSFRNTIKLLKQSVHEHDGPHRDAAMSELDMFFTVEKQTMGGIGMAFAIEDLSGKVKQVNVPTLLDAYFHGKYLHSGNDKSKLAALLDDMGPFAPLTLFNVMLGLRNLYWMTANAAEAALKNAA